VVVKVNKNDSANSSEGVLRANEGFRRWKLQNISTQGSSKIEDSFERSNNPYDDIKKGIRSNEGSC
jgi:hypothetical protein